MQARSIAEQLLFTTVRIDTLSDEGKVGSGTGFLYVEQVGDASIPVVVSNKHVVYGSSKGFVTFTIRDGDGPKLGHGFRLQIDGFHDAWFGHPDSSVDVAVLPLAPLEDRMRERGVSVFYRSVSKDLIPSDDQITELDAFEELVFIGYPNGIWDRKNLLPIMRTGTTATPIYIDFEGEPKFLMDASIFPGSSGSPVFIYNPGMYFSKTGTTTVASRLMFVGVVAGVFCRLDLGDIVSIPVPTQRERAVALTREMIDLGIVFKARTVSETMAALAESKGIVA